MLISLLFLYNKHNACIFSSLFDQEVLVLSTLSLSAVQKLINSQTFFSACTICTLTWNSKRKKNIIFTYFLKPILIKLCWWFTLIFSITLLLYSSQVNRHGIPPFKMRFFQIAWYILSTICFGLLPRPWTFFVLWFFLLTQ